jgi:cation:H+ antiporter
MIRPAAARRSAPVALQVGRHRHAFTILASRVARRRGALRRNGKTRLAAPRKMPIFSRVSGHICTRSSAMVESSLYMIGGFAVLYVGAEGLIRGGASLALRMGIAPLVVGLTIVAFGTSSPELIVSLQAALAGSGSIAVGNVVGSNICNVALILGMAAVIRPLKVEARIIRRHVPIVIGCSALLVLFLLDNRLGRIEGSIFAIGMVGYVVFSIRESRTEKQAVFDGALPTTGRRAIFDVAFVAGGLGLLLLGGSLFLDGAVAAARLMGLSEAVIGLTIVAVGTSLPELATSAVAAYRGEGDLAIGNVIGSNIFNILGILGVTSLIRPIVSQGIGAADVGVMTMLAVVLLPLMRTGFRLNRWEGLLLLAAYAAYIAYRIA